MKYSFRAFVLLICLLLPLCAMAQGLELAQPLTGLRTYPEGANEEEANYVFRYAYPQFEAVAETDRAINAYYQAVSQDMASNMGEQNAEEAELTHEEGMPPAYTEIAWQIMLNNERYVSVMLTARQFLGNAESEMVSADTFARDGLYAGQPITLSQVLGLEQEGDELSTEESIAEKLAYRLVWEIVERDMQNVDADYLDGLNEESLRAAFSPETDFYLDADGNVVFFIQAGSIAGEVAGVLTYPFAPAELLSAVKE